MKAEKEHLEKEAAVHQEVAIKKVTEMAERRAQEDMEEKWAEAVKKIRAAEETTRQREESVVARPSGVWGPGLQ